ncbi:MAG: UDP-glucose/GDP-mannose dehydrogenase family protein [Rhabdochlamydiaceae bacterium]|nr:UDP-glucose/GDP-mannose dehydrogenase family protein [Rhabdochlamydiaceae bacterium]
MEIAVVGVGYVGLVSAAGFCEMGHRVTCIDIDSNKVESLQQGTIPFYEPGLKEIVLRNSEAKRLSFTCEYGPAIQEAEVCFIAVPTPSQEDGSCDLSYVLSAAKKIAEEMSCYCLIVIKSTVPIGSTDKVKEVISDTLETRGLCISFDIVFNPEFLKEGCAVQDCLKPDRIVIGAENTKSIELMRKIYAPFTLNHDRILVMDIRSAEMTKYAANAMLATRISFMNELSLLCEKLGANIHDVRIGIGSDARIGYQFLYAGIGYGGSCFPKDIQALLKTAEQASIEMPILNAVETINQRQRLHFAQKILSYYEMQGAIAGKTLAIWGLSFKPDTDDMRQAPSLTLIQILLDQGVHLRLFDPVAMPNAQKIFPPSQRMVYAKDEYEAAYGADGIVLLTEWKQFRFVDFKKILSDLKGNAFFDGRNQYHPHEMAEKGFNYFCIGHAPCGSLKPLEEALPTI